MLEDEEEAIIRAAYVPPRHTMEVRMADGVPGALFVCTTFIAC